MPYYIACKTCYGTGKLDCQQCKGLGKIKSGFFKQMKNCNKCSGKGFITCDDCKGEGKKIKYII